MKEAEYLLTKVQASWRNKGNYSIKWEKGYKEEALSLARQNGLTGYKSGCPSCELILLNKIRELAGYPPLQQEDKSLRERRLEICKGCEHLLFGTNCKKCGCFVHIKASFKIFQCPLKKWPDE